MLLRGYEKDGNWIHTEWKLTFPMDWTQIVHAIAAQIPYTSDYSIFCGRANGELRDITSFVHKKNGNLVETGILKLDGSVLQLRGTLFEMPVDITMKCASEFMQMTFHYADDFPEDNELVVLTWLYDSFGRMFDSMEILGHVHGLIASLSES